MNTMEIEFINEFIDVCHRGYNHGWHEANGGNLSYRLTRENVKDIEKNFNTDNTRSFDLGVDIPVLANEYFLVTASGAHFGTIKKKTENKIGIIKLCEKGRNYEILWGFEGENKPTSELPSHLLNHSVKVANAKKEYRVIYHAHTTNLISMSFILPMDWKLYSRILWEMATECSIIFSEGVGLVEWMVPGGVEIGQRSSELMEDFDIVLWAHHGTFCAGESLEKTFGVMETVEKSADIFMKLLASNKNISQTITSENFKSLAEAFNIELNQEVLNYQIGGIGK